jgi:hypothetical protein
MRIIDANERVDFHPPPGENVVGESTKVFFKRRLSAQAHCLALVQALLLLSLMKTQTTFGAAMVALALLVLGAQTGYAQTGNTPGGYAKAGQRDARPRDLVALQDDLRLLDDSLYAMARQNPRRQEFERRAGVIRTDVSNLVEQMNRNGAGRPNVVIPRSGRFASRSPSFAMTSMGSKTPDRRAGPRLT